MVRALGYSIDSFDPNDPGRLCRGRERWIDPLPLEGAPPLSRLVVSGAAFSDETASDAQRGLRFSGIGAGEVISMLFPGRSILALAEDAHPLTIPADAAEIEHYSLVRPYGPLKIWRVRWRLACPDAASVDAAIEAGADVLLVGGPRGRGAPKVEPLPEAVEEAITLLVGFRQDGTPGRRFQATAIPALLEHATAVLLVHLDKHGPSLGVYTREPLVAREPLERIAKARGALSVPFAIPPMLARWDRALWELRQGWDDRTTGDFPVPPVAEPVKRARQGASEEE